MSAPELAIAAALRRGLAAVPMGARVAQQRQRLLDTIRLQSATRTRRWDPTWVWAGVAGAALAAALVVMLPHSTTIAEPVKAALTGAPLKEGGWIETVDTPQTLTFSEGSRVQVAGHSKARIGRLSTEAANIILESGKIHAKITKDTGLTWTIAAGPYRVRVVGTEFDVEWNFASQRFAVRVQEGNVRVAGAALPREGLALVPGQTLERTPPQIATADPVQPTPAPRTGETNGPAKAVRSARHGAPPAHASTISWQQLARDGKYAKALRAAQSMGIAAQLDGANAEDLLLLANTARYAGDGRTAHAAFIRLRERYPGDRTASLAAFSLGKLAIDTEGNPAEAARWFKTFLQESPRGDLAAGARARLMNALLAQGDRNGAESVARDYLEFHPGGPQRDTARALLGAPKSQ